jgi:CRP-like cAMP-binding protein
VPFFSQDLPVAETFLEALAPADRDALLAATRNRALGTGDVLFRHGELGTTFAVLLSGRVKIVTHSGRGRSVLVGLRGPGELVGELAVLDDTPRGADVIAVEPVRVGIGTADVLRRLVMERPGPMLVLCQSLVSRLRESDGGRVQMAALTGNARVAVRLLELGERYGHAVEGGVHIQLPITQDELADWTGLSRPAVARALAEFRQSGHVVTGRRSMALSDPERLRAYITTTDGD